MFLRHDILYTLEPYRTPCFYRAQEKSLREYLELEFPWLLGFGKGTPGRTWGDVTVECLALLPFWDGYLRFFWVLKRS